MDCSSGQGSSSSANTHAWKKAVSRFGQRWKVQYENCGVLYYLGTFDTQEEAIRAYEFKARSMESPLINAGVPMETLSYPAPLPSSSSSVPAPPSAASSAAEAEVRNRMEARALWDRLTTIYQRLLLSKAVQSKLSDLQLSFPDQHKEVLLKTLNEEMVMLSLVKTQLEEAMVYYFSSEVAINELPDMTALGHWDLTSMLNQSQSSMFPISHILTPVDPPGEIIQHPANEFADFSTNPDNVDHTTGKFPKAAKASHPKPTKPKQPKSTKPLKAAASGPTSSTTLPSYDAAISNPPESDPTEAAFQLQSLTPNVESVLPESASITIPQQVEIAPGNNVAFIPSLAIITGEAPFRAYPSSTFQLPRLPEQVTTAQLQNPTSEVDLSTSDHSIFITVHESTVQDTMMDI